MLHSCPIDWVHFTILLDSKAAELATTGDLPRQAAYALAQTGQLQQAVLILEQGRARGLSETLERDRADLVRLQQTHPDLTVEYQNITTQLRNLEVQERQWMTSANRYSLTPDAFRTTALQLRQALTEAIEQIRQVEGYTDFLAQPNFGDIQQAVCHSTPLVYLVLTSAGSLALIVTQDGIVDLGLDNFTETELIDLLNNIWFNAYKKSQRNYQIWQNTIDQVTHQLWQSLMAPLIDHLKQHSFQQATIIPTGYLSLLPLHAAWTEDATTATGRRYALDEILFTYAPNAQSLNVAAAILQRTRANSILAIDNPTQDLPNSSCEVTAAVTRFPQHEVLKHKEATIESVLAALPHYNILHFSCHGTANLREPLNSGLAMSDGLLTLRNLLDLKLVEQGGIRLAILSACETGLTGIELADEAIGLPTGLLQAGVAGVVASLWAVSDLSTMMILVRFYDLWRKDGWSPAGALRQAQKWVRDTTSQQKAKYFEKTNPDIFHSLILLAPKHFAHPFHWAAFSYVGEVCSYSILERLNMYSSEDILEAARSIRPHLMGLLNAELAIEIDQKLVELLAQADSGQSVENLILALLASQDATREWLRDKLNQPQSEQLRTWNPTRGGTENGTEKGIEDSLDEFIHCYVHAEMDTHVIVQRVTTVEVTISKEAIEFVSSATAKREQIQIDPLKALIIQVIPKINFESVGDSRIEIESLNLETPQHLYFDLRPTHLGEGEVWVVFRQSQLPLLTLTLTPQIVESRAQIPQRLSANGSIQSIPHLLEPLHQLRIIERRNGTQITYDYELDSPSLNILGRYESKPITSDRQQYVEALYREIESRWRSVQADVEAFAAELRGFGGQLLDELFPEALQRQLWEHRQEIQSIMVISTEPFIPWELVHLKPPGQAFLPDEVCFLGQLGLVRWLYDVGFPPESITLHADRCRYVIPHYPDRDDSPPPLRQAEQEAQFLEQTFQATAIEPQPNPVRQALESASFDLLHFAGHGQAEHGSTSTANLLLEGRIESGNYIPAMLSATTVSQYCRFKVGKNQPIVLLNACQIGRTGYALTGISGFAQAFLRGGAGAFIGSL